MKKWNGCLLIFLLLSLSANVAYSSFITTGPNGINSRGLGLTGDGVGIGQVELFRPSDNDFDTSSTFVNSNVNPAEVFYASRSTFGTMSTTATINEASEMRDNPGDTGHATQMASVMISSGTGTAGVSPDASLYSAGYTVGALQSVPDMAAFATQHVATRPVPSSPSGRVHAVNMSFGLGLTGYLNDGTSLLSSFVDWSSRVHDVLYVTSGNQIGPSAENNMRWPRLDGRLFP